MNNSRVYNLLSAVPLLAWYIWSLSDQVPRFVQHCALLFGNTGTSTLPALQVAAQASSIAFMSLLVLLLIVRDVPRGSLRSFAAYIATYVGTFTPMTFFFLPLSSITATTLSIATLLTLTGFALSVYALIYLGRSFAILPSARTLVTNGPYRYVRHPLYLFEEIAVIGIMLQFAQPWSLLIFIIHFAAQLTRMHYEEKALAQAFPEYLTYATRTARLIPGFY